MNVRIQTFQSLVLICTIFGSTNTFADHRLDNAADIAGVRVSRKLAALHLPIERIALLPYADDKLGLSSVIIAAITKFPGPYAYVLDTGSREWQKIYREIERGGRQHDIMNLDTIQAFGRIVGADALCSGVIRETNEDQGLIRLTVRLIEVETGTILWADNVTIYEKSQSSLAIDEKVDRAAQDAGFKIVRALEGAHLGITRIGVVPAVGDDRYDISSIIEAELNRVPSSFEFFTRSTSTWQVLYEEAGRDHKGQHDVDIAAIRRRQGANRADAILTTSIRNISTREEDSIREAGIRLTAQLLDVASGRTLWSAVINGRYAEPVIVESDSFLNELAGRCGDRFAQSMLNESLIDDLEIYVLPILSDKKIDLESMIMPQLHRIKSERNIRFIHHLDDPMLRRIGEILSVSSPDDPQAVSIINNLNKLDRVLAGGSVDIDFLHGDDAPRRAALFGRVIDAESHNADHLLDYSDGAKGYGFLTIELKLAVPKRDGRGLEILWMDTATVRVDRPRKPVPPQPSSWLLALQNVRDHGDFRMIVIGGYIVVGILIVALSATTVYWMVTRPR